MALDQYGGFGMGAPVPRRIYALVRLSASTKRGEVAKFEGGGGDVIEGIGGGMKIDGVTGVLYATVRLSILALHEIKLKGVLIDSRVGTFTSSSDTPRGRCSRSDQIRRCGRILCSGCVLVSACYNPANNSPLCGIDSPYQDRLTLKAPNTDQILGLGVLTTFQSPMHSFSAEQEQGGGAGPEDMLILTAGVLMRARVDLGRVKSFDEA